MALHPNTPINTLLKSFHEKFVLFDVIQHPAKIRFTKAKCSVSNMPLFCINPSVSFRAFGSKFLPFISPPLPSDHPLDFRDVPFLNAMKSSGRTDGKSNFAQCTHATNSERTNEDEGFNVKWLCANENDAIALNIMRKKVRHHYIYFDFFKKCDWAGITPGVGNMESMLSPLPVLFAGRIAIPASPFCSNSMYLPLVNLTFNLGQDARVHDVLRCFVIEASKVKVPFLSDKGEDEDRICQKQYLSKDNRNFYLPVLLLVKKNRIMRLLRYEEIVDSIYPYDSLLELPRGQVRSGSTRSGRRRRNTGPACTLNLQWNPEARQGCVEIGSTTVGSLVVDFLPLDAVLNDLCEEFPIESNTDCISRVGKSFLQWNEPLLSTFPSVIPVQVVFYLEECSKDLQLRYIPLLTFLRKQDNVRILRKRIFHRLNERTIIRVNGEKDDCSHERKARKQTNFEGSLLTWKLTLLSFQGRIKEHLTCGIQDKHVNGEPDGDTCKSEDVESVLWCKVKEIWPMAFMRRGGMTRMLRSLYKVDDCNEDQSADDFVCFGHNSDLPTFGMAVPLKAFEDLVRCRAGCVVGSAHFFKFNGMNSKLHKSTPIPANEEGSKDLMRDTKQWKYECSEGIVIRD